MTQKRARLSAEDRKSQILEAATDLLGSHPWEDVTVARLLKASGLSKGGFYHHFTSKEDVLREVILRLTDASAAAGQAVSAGREGSAVDRFAAYMIGALRWELDHADQIMAVIRIAMMAGNEPIFLQLDQEIRCRSTPRLETLVQQGADEGGFEIVDTKMTVDLIHTVWRSRWLDLSAAREVARAGDLAGAQSLVATRLRAEADMIARLVGRPEADFQLDRVGDFTAFLQSY